MARSWLQRRDDLLDQQDHLVEAWPTRVGEEFLAGIQTIATAFEQLATDAQSADGDAIEVSRTWRYAGMAWYELAETRELEWLQRARKAYQEAESHLDRGALPVDAAKLDYCVGRALLSLADGHDQSAAARAVERFAAARDAARQSAPELLSPIESDLSRAERVAGLMGQVNQLDEQIGKLRVELASGNGDGNAQEPQPHEMFQLLREQVETEKAKGTMSSTRQETLDDVMGALESLVDASGQDRSLTQMAIERQSLEELMQRMQALKRPKKG